MYTTNRSLGYENSQLLGALGIGYLANFLKKSPPVIQEKKMSVSAYHNFTSIWLN
jgi:hypothetical protein